MYLFLYITYFLLYCCLIVYLLHVLRPHGVCGMPHCVQYNATNQLRSGGERGAMLLHMHC